LADVLGRAARRGKRRGSSLRKRDHPLSPTIAGYRRSEEVVKERTRVLLESEKVRFVRIFGSINHHEKKKKSKAVGGRWIMTKGIEGPLSKTPA